MSYKRLRQGGIKNAYFRTAVRKKAWQISLIKKVLFYRIKFDFLLL